MIMDAMRGTMGWSFVALLHVAFMLPGLGWSSDAHAEPLESLALYPESIELSTAYDSQKFLVIATMTDGVTRDVTDQAEIRLDNPGIARREGKRKLVPMADGQTTLHVQWQGKTLEAPVRVEQATARPPYDFRLDIVPVLTRAGCNTGTCHGSSRGKDGFGLSLFGFDPKGDYQRVTRELASRRINLAIPESSLLLEKSIGAVAHTGGKRFEQDSRSYRTIRDWIAQGAVYAPQPSNAGEKAAADGKTNDGKDKDPQEVSVARVDLFPPQVVIQGLGKRQPLVAIAHYTDGTNRDVTDLGVFLSSDEGVASVDPEGVVTAGSRGEAFVTIRFETHTVGVPVTILPEGLPPVDETGPLPDHYIDRLIEKKLRTLRVPASGLCDDEEFLRRATVDTIGLLPTEEEYVAFMADTSENKREKKIDELLARQEFGDLWGAKWADLLMVRTVNNRVYEKSVIRYSEWLREQFANGVPLDEIAHTLLTATGHSFTNPEVNFYAREPNRLKIAEDVAQVFLGIRTQCAQCHNHPFDRWTMDDYYGFAAFFARVRDKGHEDYRQLIVFEGGGETQHPVTRQPVPPKFLGGEVPAIEPGVERRQTVADWLTSPDNPWFASTVANRVWDHYLGRGVIHPVDDVRVSNPPSNAELLDALASKLIEYKYDFRRLARDIMTSQAYQRTTRSVPGNEHDSRNFSHALVRRIPATTLLDCLSQVTHAPTKYPSQPLGTRAVEAPNPLNDYFLKTFGKSDRTSACACAETSEPTLSQALHMLNGDSVHGKIVSGKVVKSLLDKKKTPAEVIDALYLRSVCRKATEEEKNQLLSVVNASDDPRAALQDVFWAILNSREFLFLK